MNISRLSLRWQLSVTMMLVLSLTLVVALSLVLRNARKAVDDEVRASFEAASSSLDATILLLALRPHSSSRETWRSWADAQQRQRHLCVYLGEPVAGAGCERRPFVAGHRRSQRHRQPEAVGRRPAHRPARQVAAQPLLRRTPCPS